MESSAAGCCTLQLLDSAQGHPVQEWAFEQRDRILIGRSTENDIALTDGQVSRKHVELVWQADCWTLVSHGRNGTRVDDQLVHELELANDVIFQLGSGPSFRFLESAASSTGSQTIDGFDQSALDFLSIDEERREKEVEEIADSEAFQQLKQHAERLRGETDAADDETRGPSTETREV